MASFSRFVSAGTRMYFIDARCDSNGHEYLTIAEKSRDGSRKVRLYLHPEDFGKFTDALQQVINYITYGEED